jgi:hypothetical protein
LRDIVEGYGTKRSQTKIVTPIVEFVAAGLDPVNYSIHFDDGYDTSDEEEE